MPERIASALRPFVTELFAKAGFNVSEALRHAVVAVHPGGPKIIDRVREVLELEPAQVGASRDVLRDYGNMSSATLPHVWQRVLRDDGVQPETLVLSLAFGRASPCVAAYSESTDVLPWLLLPALLQALAMFVDEFAFHRRRGLPRWERLGHPLDTLTAAACYGFLVAVPPTAPHAVAIYVGLCAFSCLFITKDEIVHATRCEPLETWLHAVLFVLHPIVFLAFGWLWFFGIEAWLTPCALASTLALAAYQFAFWNLRSGPDRAPLEDAE